MIFVPRFHWSLVICLGFEWQSKRSKGSHLDGTDSSKTQANFGQSHSGLSLLAAVVSRAVGSLLVFGRSATCSSRIQLRYFRPTSKSKFCRLTAYSATGQSVATWHGKCAFLSSFKDSVECRRWKCFSDSGLTGGSFGFFFFQKMTKKENK